MSCYDDRLDSLKSSTILMVDDEETTLDVLEAFLEGEGYENLIRTSDSTLALDLINQKSPDVVLLDLNMPEIGGFEILQELRADERLRHTPVIILTSATDGDTKLKALELGATDFLGKPLDPSELALRLRNTLAAKAYQDRLAYFDGLTGLPNRHSFMERTDRALRRARYASQRCALLHISLEGYERINDTLGHRIGDSLLRTAANRLESCLRINDPMTAPTREGSDIIARLGSNEFAVFLTPSGSADQTARIARRMIDQLEKAFRPEDQDLFVSSSIGIALFPEDGSDSETLVRYARMAQDKQSHHRYQFYSRSLNEESLERLSLENQLRGALERGEMEMHFQPQANLKSGEIVGAEALMRWNHPQLGMIAPVRFIPLAEQTGLITDLGDWALRIACRQCAEWRANGSDLRMAVNVSTRQLLFGDLLGTVRDALDESGLPGEKLVIELTEGTVMENPKESSEILRKLKELDVRISIDDFGTGYSALAYLRRFPIDELKIDRSFVQGLPSDVDGAAIVDAIIGMAHSLGLRVVAEGVETPAQLSFLEERGCDELQGFLYGRPEPASNWAPFLRGGAGCDSR